MNQLIESWRELEMGGNFFKLKGDNVQEGKYSTYAGFIESKDFGEPSTAFHLGLLPQPYIGNLASAKVFLLMLNPGFSPGDYYAQEHSETFKQARVTNLKQENGADDYPFFYLNPKFAWTAGGQWWQNKLRSIATKLMQQKHLNYQAALQHISKHIACIELCPYFSKQYKPVKPLFPSMELALEYVQVEIKKKCQAGEAVTIVMRQVQTWGLEKEENIVFIAPQHARGAHLTIDTEAGRRIYSEIADLVS